MVNNAGEIESFKVYHLDNKGKPQLVDFVNQIRKTTIKK
jgi:hypothetical protein